MISILAITTFLTSIIFYQSVKGQMANNTTKKTSIDSIIEKTMTETGIVGVGTSIIIDKKVVWAKRHGYADKEHKIPFSPSTIINIASISKTFTGACIMKAIEEGKVSLDEGINNYLPFKVINPNFPNEKITLRHLATHTSGLVARHPFYASTYYYGGENPEPLVEFVKNYFVQGSKHYSKDNFLNAKPGTERLRLKPLYYI